MDRRRSLLKIAALRTEREHQEGASTAEGGFTSDAPELREPPFTVQCVFVPRSVAAQQTIFVTNQGSSSPRIDILTNGNIVLYFGASANYIPVVIGRVYDIVFVCEQGRQSAYVDGELIATREYTFPETIAYYNLGFYVPSAMNRFDGDYLLHRHFDYVLSAEEVATLHNNGDPAGYVLPAAMKGLAPIEIVGGNSYTWTGVDDPTYSYAVRYSRPFTIGKVYKIRLIVSDWEAGNAPFIKIGSTGSYYLPDFNGNGTYEIYAIPNGTPYTAVYIYAGLLGTDRRMTLTVDSIEPVGCIAECLPQNLVVARKQDFPQVVFPVASYTPSSGVFRLNNSSFTTMQNNQPQANGFSGAYTRFDAITIISLYCAYMSDFIKKQAPLKITFEYRSNRILYSSNISVSPTAPDAVVIDVNEGDAKIASVTYGVGRSAYIFSDSDPEAWMEMRVLSIEVAEGAVLSWLDSAKQLPLNDEYLPPLLQSDGGYDLTANGMPEIIIK